MCQNKSQAKDCLRGHKANIKKQVRRNRFQAKIQPFAAETSTTKSANDIPCSHKERCENLSDIHQIPTVGRWLLGRDKTYIYPALAQSGSQI